MKFLTRHYKRLRISGLKVALVVIFLNILFVPQYKRFVSDGNNLFTVYLNDEYVGKVGKQTDVEKLLIEARREIAANSDSILFVQASIRTEGEEVIFGKTDSNKTIKKKMVDILSKSVHEGLTPAYAVKIGTFTVNLGSLDDVRRVLQAAVDKYDENHEYAVSLMKDPNRELNALTAVVVAKEDIKDENKEKELLKVIRREIALTPGDNAESDSMHTPFIIPHPVLTDDGANAIVIQYGTKALQSGPIVISNNSSQLAVVDTTDSIVNLGSIINNAGGSIETGYLNNSGLITNDENANITAGSITNNYIIANVGNITSENLVNTGIILNDGNITIAEENGNDATGAKNQQIILHVGADSGQATKIENDATGAKNGQVILQVGANANGIAVVDTTNSIINSGSIVNTKDGTIKTNTIINSGYFENAGTSA